MSDFDLFKIFFGNESSWAFLIEILFRTSVMYFWLLLNVRLLGKRGIGELSAFEFIVVIALGSAAGDPMFYQDIPLSFGMIVITTVVILERIISHFSERYLSVEQLVNGEPTLLIKDGKIIEIALDGQELNREELFEMLRLASVRNVGEVEVGVLEASGKLSVIRFADNQVRQGISTIEELGSNTKK